ncbi:Putative mannosyltransferase involved in polysaccharide biosynthesis [Photobacterium marinum]|uniref:Putative mannosyltransferase involved in polysaccharide biosynthesis n=1 Tax=Photobacterium marinum TaxID=1056511 RepID=L8J6A5_9GAMM|nr:glycosyltransferase [Photobacterium marinum]ELR64276.1 Putative mannosyltransferase involved in polysaccharide biosynthesis [Photobacterium marinum]
MAINKVIHAVWLGGKLNSFSSACIDDWDKQGYTYKLWKDSDPFVVKLINECEFARECYERKLYAFVTDYLRLKILSLEGGLYLDTDVTINKDPFPLFENVQFAAGWENERNLCNAVIYATTESKILSKLIYFYEHEIMRSPLYMGPEILTTKLVEQDFQHVEACTLFEQAYFYAYDGTTVQENNEIERYLTHWYQHSWKDSKGMSFIKSKHQGFFGKLYTYQKSFFRLRHKK